MWTSQFPSSGGGGGATSASQVSFTPTAGISATTVQAALAEVDVEKLSFATGTLAARPASYAVNTLYVVRGDTVANNGKASLYVTSISTWVDFLVGSGGSGAASGITLTPTGDVAATDVQAGIAELSSEKLAFSTGTLASRPANPNVRTLYVVSGDTATNNDVAYVYNTTTSTWLRIFAPKSSTDISHVPTADLTASANTVNNAINQLAFGKMRVLSGTLADFNALVNPSYSAAFMVRGDTDVNNGKLFINLPGVAWVPIQGGLDTETASTAPIGFAELTKQTGSTISFNEATGTFTIAPTSGVYDIIYYGKLLNKFTAETVQIASVTGLHYIFFTQHGILSASTTQFDFKSQIPIAMIYWNATTSKAVLLMDERHGSSMDPATHEYLHRTRGASISFVPSVGFAGTISTAGDGNSIADAQIGIAPGTFYDEDIKIDITASVTPVANTWQQDIAFPGKFPVFYRSGAVYTIDVATTSPLKFGTLRPVYNLNTAGTWSTPDVDNNKFFVQFIVATNNLNSPIISIMGQNQYNTRSDADDVNFSDLNLSGLPIAELRPLYKIVFKTSNTMTNSVKANIVSFFDLRLTTTSTGSVTQNTIDNEFRNTPQNVFAYNPTASTAWDSYINGLVGENRLKSDMLLYSQSGVDDQVLEVDVNVAIHTSGMITTPATVAQNLSWTLSSALPAGFLNNDYVLFYIADFSFIGIGRYSTAGTDNVISTVYYDRSQTYVANTTYPVNVKRLRSINVSGGASVGTLDQVILQGNSTNRDVVLGGNNQLGGANKTISLGTDGSFTTPLNAADSLSPSSLSAGTAGQFLTSSGPSATPHWSTLLLAGVNDFSTNYWEPSQRIVNVSNSGNNLTITLSDPVTLASGTFICFKPTFDGFSSTNPMIATLTANVTASTTISASVDSSPQTWTGDAIDRSLFYLSNYAASVATPTAIRYDDTTSKWVAMSQLEARLRYTQGTNSGNVLEGYFNGISLRQPNNATPSQTTIKDAYTGNGLAKTITLPATFPATADRQVLAVSTVPSSNSVVTEWKDMRTWTDYVSRWTTPPVQVNTAIVTATINGEQYLGNVYQYDSVFRFVPNSYQSFLDTIWDDFNVVTNTLSNLLLSRNNL